MTFLLFSTVMWFPQTKAVKYRIIQSLELLKIWYKCSVGSLCICSLWCLWVYMHGNIPICHYDYLIPSSWVLLYIPVCGCNFNDINSNCSWCHNNKSVCINRKQTRLINTYTAGIIHYWRLPFSIIKRGTGREVLPQSARLNWAE